MAKASGLKKGDFRVDPIFVFVLGIVVLLIILAFFIPSLKNLFEKLLDVVNTVITKLKTP
jgi:flagellar biosynthesis protein FliR